MTIGAQFTTRNEVEVLRRKIERAISGAAIAQHIIDPGAVDAFTDLTDVPEDYAGAGNFLVRVAAAEDELEFVELMLADLADVYFPSGEPDIGDVLTYESGGWTSMPGGAGVSSFNDLDDVPAVYVAGDVAKIVRVNPTHDGLEFGTIITISDNAATGGNDGDIWLEY